MEKLVPLIAFLSISCNNETSAKKSVTNIVSGTDTIVVTHFPNEELSFDVSKAHSTRGHNDTTTGIQTITFCNTSKKDSQFINSGNGQQNSNTGSGTQIINY